MKTSRLLILPVALTLSLAAASSAFAAGQARLELVGSQAVAMAFQEWSQTLSKAGIKNVRIRSGDGSEKVGVETSGTEKSPLYIVTGLIVSRDELLLPAGRFKRTDAGRLARWLDELAAQGPPDRRPQRTVFGLTKEQYAEVQTDLGRAVGFSTHGMSRADAVEKIGRQLRLPLKAEAGWDKAGGDEEDKIEEDLSEFSCGTALACILRPAGYCLVARDAGSRASLGIVKARPELEVWPVGWEPQNQTTGQRLLPAMAESLNVNIQNFPAAKAIDAIAKRVKAPVLMDHNALARHGIDPAKVTVSLPQGRMTYDQALRRLTFQAKLKFEIRADEAGKLFLWITTQKAV
jgi:hypothetical protein